MNKFIPLALLLFLFTACKKGGPEKKDPAPEPPKPGVTVSLSAAKNIGFYEATVNFTLETNKNEVFDYGLVWDVNPSPTTSNTNKITKGACPGTCPFETVIKNLQAGTKYYYRAFYITAAGIAYSSELSFTTTEMPWTKETDLPGGGRMLGIAFSIGNKGYVGLGMGQGNLFLKDFWEYNIEAKTWTRKADFPGGVRIGAVGFAINNKGYVGTGLDGGYLGTSDFWEYDPATDKWTRKADYLGGTLEYGVGMAIGEKGYIGIGTRRSTNQVVKEFYEYSPAANQWTKRADFPGVEVNNCLNFTINGKGYVGIGQLSLGGLTRQFYEFDPSSNSWTVKKEFPGSARYYTVGFSINGKGYSCSGRYGGTEVLEYDPATDQWKNMPNFLGQAREGLSAFVVNNQAYVGLGSTGFAYLADIWKFKVPN